MNMRKFCGRNWQYSTFENVAKKEKENSPKAILVWLSLWSGGKGQLSGDLILHQLLPFLVESERECQWRGIFKVYYLNICDQISAFVFKRWTLILIQWKFGLNVDFGPKDDDGNMLQYFNIFFILFTNITTLHFWLFHRVGDWLKTIYSHTRGIGKRMTGFRNHLFSCFDKFRSFQI